MIDEGTILARRIREKLKERGLSPWKASKLAVNNPDAIRQIYNGHEPGADRLAKIATVLETTPDWLLGKDLDPEPIAMTREPGRAFLGREGPRDVPVLGTAFGAALSFPDDGGSIEIESTFIEPGEPIEYVLRPPALAGRTDVYALYIQGESMAPRHRQGSRIYVDAKRPPKPGDDVVVQLFDESGDGDEMVIALIKELVRVGASHIELRQHTPALTFTLERPRVRYLHRVLTMEDLMGF